MLTREQLTTLHRSLGSARVLSVYIDGTATDPAIQRTWRLQLEHRLKDLRVWLADSPRDEREQFERCVRLLDGELAAFGVTSVGAPGWVAFITSDGTREAHQVPVPMPTLAVWSTGACIAPYVRALKETRPVIVVIADARRADLYCYRFGALERLERLRAHHSIDHPSHMAAPPRAGFHSGTRGTAGHDAAQRALLSGRDRMLADAVERVRELSGADGWIVLGGTSRVVARLAEQLSVVAPNRVLERNALDVHATDAQISEAARTGASALRSAADAAAVGEIVELAEAGGLGVTGPMATAYALDRTCVRELYLSPRYLEEHGADAEDAVRTALNQNALVVDVSGQAAERLDEYGGMAARLRFRVKEGSDRAGAQSSEPVGAGMG